MPPHRGEAVSREGGDRSGVTRPACPVSAEESGVAPRLIRVARGPVTDSTGLVLTVEPLEASSAGAEPLAGGRASP